MQHDTSKTFREIHGTKEVLKQNLEKMGRLALTRAKKYHDQTALHLRFLTPLKPQPPGDKNVVHLRLTHLNEYTTSSPYISVSYTWRQPEGLEAMFRNSMPEYRIWTTDPAPRPPKCPSLVLHQAYTFACEYLNTPPLIWIDQECIMQDDPEDIEAHLQIMHVIYQRSAYTAAVLSTLITSPDMFKSLQPFTDALDVDIEQVLFNNGHGERRDMMFHEALKYLSTDAYFTRTWTYQERRCATSCYFLAPLSPEMISRSKATGFYGPSCRISTNKLSRIQQIVIKYWNAGSPSHGYEQLYSIGGFVYEVFGAPVAKSDRPIGWSIRMSWGTFDQTESCSNEKVSDRIAIFSNVCRLSWTLKSSLLNSHEFSYSTALLLLLAHNRLSGDNMEHFLDGILMWGWDQRIGDVMGTIARDAERIQAT